MMYNFDTLSCRHDKLYVYAVSIGSITTATDFTQE